MFDNFQSLVNAANDGFRYGLGTASPVSSPVGAGARAAGLAGKYGAQMAKFSAMPAVAAIAGGLPGLMEGDLLQAGGGAAGGAAGGLLAKAVTIPLAGIPGIGPALAVGANVALPWIGATIGDRIGDSLNQPAQAATTAAGNKLDPGSLNNRALNATEAVVAQADEVRRKYGDDVAKAYLQQNLMLSNLYDLEERKAKTGLALLPARSAAKYNELGIKGAIESNLLAQQGVNTVANTLASNNPWADFLAV
jgi:hypothetical protein